MMPSTLRLVKALEGTAYSIYYESARAEQLQSNGLLANMLTESSTGVPAAVHTYYHNMSEDPTPHMAAFMLGQAKNWYAQFLGFNRVGLTFVSQKLLMIENVWEKPYMYQVLAND